MPWCKPSPARSPMLSLRRRPDRMSTLPRKAALVCTHLRANPAQPSCGARGGRLLAERLAQAIQAKELDIQLETFACLGQCEAGPNLKLSPGGALCSHLNPDDLAPLLNEIVAFIASSDISP